MTGQSERFFQMQEREVAYKVPCSSAEFEGLSDLFKFPEDVRGLRILDIGGGASDATARLLALGADAYAIDPRYENPRRVLRDVETYLNYSNESRLDKDVNHQTMAVFRASIREHPKRYINGGVGSLPFDDSSVDFIYSHLALGELLTRNVMVLKRGLAECFRVLKPGSEMQAIPWGLQTRGPLDQNEPGVRQMLLALKNGLVESESFMKELGFDFRLEEQVFLHAIKRA